MYLKATTTTCCCTNKGSPSGMEHFRPATRAEQAGTCSTPGMERFGRLWSKGKGKLWQWISGPMESVVAYGPSRQEVRDPVYPRINSAHPLTLGCQFRATQPGMSPITWRATHSRPAPCRGLLNGTIHPISGPDALWTLTVRTDSRLSLVRIGAARNHRIEARQGS